MKTHKISRKAFHAMVAVLVIGLASTLVSAALLTYFGQVQTTANIQQAVVISADGTNWNNYNTPITHTIPEPAPGGETFCVKQWIWNRASIPVAVSFATNSYAGITTTSTLGVHEITDNNHNFGSRDNEVVAFLPETGLTLDDLFAGNGLSYAYTIINGGTYTGASPIIAVIDLADGRHVVLFPGWGARTGGESLQFSDTVATSTSDGGAVPVDFTVYASNFAGGAQWSSNAQYGNWNFLKATGSSTGGSLPLGGNEFVTRIAIQHQGADTGETDRIDSLTFGGTIYTFADGTLQSGEILPFRICYAFDLHIGPGTYILTTTVDAHTI